MKLTGIAAWAFLTKPKPASKYKGKPIPASYAVNLLLDVQTAKKLHKEGFNVKKVKEEIPGIPDAEGQYYLTIKKPADHKGTPTTPPEIVDAQLNPFSGLIGNGSKITVVFAAKEWEMELGQTVATGIAAKLRKVQVLDLVEYGGKEEEEDLEEFAKEEGFIAAETSSEKVKKDLDEVFGDDSDDDLAF